MRVYIDLVLIVNFLFDYFLLCSINYILRRNIKMKRIILGSVTGSITILFIFINLSTNILLLLKLLISIIMLLVTFGYKNFSYFKKNIIYFYLVSMLLGGSIYFLKNQFSYTNHGLIWNKHSLSISYIIIVIIGLLIYLKFMKYFKDLKNNYSNYYNGKVYLTDNYSIDVTAFLDTGNKLNDPYSNKSIILIKKEKLNDYKNKNPVYIPYNSLNNHGLLTCYKANKIIINGKETKDFLIGVSEENFFIDGIDCIINNRIMEGLK